MTRHKTREEKIQSGYRLQNFKLKAEGITAAKDVSEFSYLSSEYVKKDLRKTIVFTLIILGLLFFAKIKLG
jgi:hypothetical protein